MLFKQKEGSCVAEVCWDCVCSEVKECFGAIVHGTRHCHSDASYVVSFLFKKMNRSWAHKTEKGKCLYH